MDTSPEYILQCEQATEIQTQKPAGQNWALGDWYWDTSVHQVEAFGSSNGYDDYFTKHLTWEFWLPRQDQLQEMVFPSGTPYNRIIQHFVYDWLADTNRRGFGATFQVQSMEQLWLAFVMHEKYNKVWDSEKKEWVTTPS